jgi:hypothetical protein
MGAFTIVLEALRLHGNGKLVIRVHEPKEPSDAEAAAE